ncbi:MAG TPA: phosphoribosyltransferase family protein [Solirubrobacteraceae bacterium]|jgi:orotate phosphoribosyltransferase|nr:phosphoribosyltransferase family protein [Solirubrobacteraceae bacterium]
MSATTITRPPTSTDREELVELLTKFALVKEDVTLSSGAKAKYLVDAKRVVMSPAGFQVIGRLVREQIARLGATAVGGLTLGADPIAYATLAVGANAKVFVVRKEPKEHGLRQAIEGVPLTAGDRCLVVDDVVTTGKSTITAVNALVARGLTICGVVCICDRLAGGGEAIREAIGDAPYLALTTIDEVYPERPDH